MEQQHGGKMEKLLDLSVICRACLSVTSSAISVTNKDLKYNIPLAAMINQISAFERQENDKFPDRLCFACAEQLRIAYGFQQTCDESYRILLNHLSQLELQQQQQQQAKETKKADVSGCQVTGRLDQQDVPVDFFNDVKKVDEYMEEYLVESDVPVEAAPSDMKVESTHVDMIAEATSSDMKAEATQSDNKGEATHSDNKAEECSDTDEELEPITVPGEDGILEIENQCSICGQILSKLSHLQRHMRSHDGAKPFQCTRCDKSFSRLDNLQIHEKLHSSDRRYKCPQCDQSFKRVDMVKMHMGTKHREFVNANYHLCTVCDNFFQTKEKLIDHMERHNSDNQLVCEICGKLFVRQLAYEAHMQRHANTPDTFDCAHCDKKFTSKASLALHLRYYTANKPYQCKYCGKRFLRATDLHIHEGYHTGTKPHACGTCGKRFHRKCTLKDHMRIHTDDKPYQCSYCEKRFHQKYDMITHERRHTGERFQCDLCVLKFMHVHQLNSHRKFVHNCTEVQCRSRGVKKFFDDSTEQTEPQLIEEKEA